MFDRPALTDARILAVLRDRFGFAATRVEFLGLGHDANAWTFRAWADGGAEPPSLFLKVRRTIDLVRLRLMGFLASHGVPEVVAPLPALDGRLSSEIDDLILIAYPFIEGSNAMTVGLTDPQWIAYGSFLRHLHDAELPPDLAASLPREDFVPWWSTAIRELDERFGRNATNGPVDAISDAVGTLWQARHQDIERLRGRTDSLGAELRERVSSGVAAPEFVVCHADIHTNNVLLAASGELRVIDWDDAILAPAERDLMFISGSTQGLPIGEREPILFGQGYGPLDVDAVALAYYRFDWVVQDITGYARESLDSAASLVSRRQALAIFEAQFKPGADMDALLAGDAPEG
jgi:spectinomycin phosphotransferase